MGMAEYFENKYGKYFAQLPDKSAYLRRIGIGDDELPITKKSLDRLQFAHLCSVPFENLDIFDYDVKIDFGIEELYDKVVTKRRGGYCFELNAIYMALLEAVGFDAYPVGVRMFMEGGSSYMPPISHRASIVTIDGKRYFTDVGAGATNAPGASICIDEYNRQDVMGEIYTVRDMPYYTKMIIRHTDAGPSDLYMFVPDPFNILDFIAYNTLIQAEGFRSKRIVNLRRPGGSISVDGDILRRTKNGERTETPLKTAADAFKAITEEFGMILPGLPGDIAVKSLSPF